LRVRQACCTFFIIFSLIATELLAQQPGGLTQFFFNAATLNPSYTGIDGRAAAFVGYRRQWAGLDGGPTLGYFNIQAPLPSQVLVGATFVSDNKGLINTTSALLTGGYSVNIDADTYLRFALSVGGAWNRVDLNNLNFVNPSDPILATLTDSNAELLGNAGISFHKKTFHAGVALPSFFEPTYVSTEGFTVANVNPFQSIVIHASNRFYFAKGKNAFEPYAVYRLNTLLPSAFEVAAVLHLQNLVWLGGSFKQDFGASAVAGFKLGKTAAVGYSYSLKNAGDNEVPFPTHEIHLGLLLGKHKKNTPMYSFINTEVEKHKKTQKEILAEKKKREEMLAKRNEPPRPAPKKEEPKPVVKREEPKPAPPRQEPVVKKEEPKKEEPKPPVTQPVVEQPKQEPPRETPKPPEHTGGPRKRVSADPLLIPVDSVPDHEREQHLHEQEILTRLEEHAEKPTEQHTEANTANAERHDFVKQGDHPEEMDLADYVIVGAFRSKENAERYDRQMIDMGFPEVHYGFLSARNLWYVYVAATNSVEEAKAARDKYRKLKMFKDAWLLTVHD
jgi:type IX secretion system PorP/SprF family membrane protein